MVAHDVDTFLKMKIKVLVQYRKKYYKIQKSFTQ